MAGRLLRAPNCLNLEAAAWPPGAPAEPATSSEAEPSSPVDSWPAPEARPRGQRRSPPRPRPRPSSQAANTLPYPATNSPPHEQPASEPQDADLYLNSQPQNAPSSPQLGSIPEEPACNPAAAAQPELKRQVLVLRELLRLERAHGRQRASNNGALQRHIERLQLEHLQLQAELVQSLELAHQIRDRNQAQLDCLQATLAERESLLEQLRARSEPSTLRREFQASQEAREQTFQLERAELRKQLEASQRQLELERTSGELRAQQLSQQLQSELSKRDGQLERLTAELAQSEQQLAQARLQPDQLMVAELRAQLNKQAAELLERDSQLQLESSQLASLQGRLESLLQDQASQQTETERQLGQLRDQIQQDRKLASELRLQLDDKQELLQVASFNLQRSEKRNKTLLASLAKRDEELDKVSQTLSLEHQQQLAKLQTSFRQLELQLLERQGQLDASRNQLASQQVEQESELESVRADRDQRLAKLVGERDRLAQQLKSLEAGFAREFQLKQNQTQLAERNQRDSQHFRSECKRLTLELSQCEARLASQQSELRRMEARLEASGATKSGSAELEAAAAKVGKELAYDLEEAERRAKRAERSSAELRNENQRLAVKLRVNEQSLAKINSSMNREHAKMLLDYERCLERLKTEQLSFDRLKLKYRRQGHRLRKYCEHLTARHAHICSPHSCGFQLSSGLAGERDTGGSGGSPSPTPPPSESVSGARDDGARVKRRPSLAATTDEATSSLDTARHPSAPAARSHAHNPAKFYFKRTRASSPALRTANNNNNNNNNKLADSAHSYCYIERRSIAR